MSVSYSLRNAALILTVSILPWFAQAADVPVTTAEAEIKRFFVDLQQALKLQGYDVGPIDGVPGKKTDAALKKYRAEKGIVGADIVETAVALGVVVRKACFWLDQRLHCPEGCTFSIASTQDRVAGYFVACPGYDTTLVTRP